MPAHHPIWDKHRGLLWSNPEAGDTAHLRAALMNPRFDCLLDAALEFGVARLSDEWRVLSHENTHEAQRARPIVERILKHISHGFALASTGN
jgi:hypothetical protein